MEEFKRQLKSLTGKLKEAENRAELAEKTVKKLQKEVDRLEGRFLGLLPKKVVHRSASLLFDEHEMSKNSFESTTTKKLLRNFSLDVSNVILYFEMRISRWLLSFMLGNLLMFGTVRQWRQNGLVFHDTLLGNGWQKNDWKSPETTSFTHNHPNSNKVYFRHQLFLLLILTKKNQKKTLNRHKFKIEKLNLIETTFFSESPTCRQSSTRKRQIQGHVPRHGSHLPRNGWILSQTPFLSVDSCLPTVMCPFTNV